MAFLLFSMQLRAVTCIIVQLHALSCSYVHYRESTVFCCCNFAVRNLIIHQKTKKTMKNLNNYVGIGIAAVLILLIVIANKQGIFKKKAEETTTAAFKRK